MIVLGRLVAPYGVRGWLKVKPYGDDPASWRAMTHWWLAPRTDGDVWKEFRLEQLRPHGAGWLAKLAGVDDRTVAERLAGWYVAAPRNVLPEVSADEFYWADLIGLRVENEKGEPLGAVESLLETGANDVLVVKAGETTRLLPFVSEVVRQVDPAAGRVVVAWELDW